MGHLYRTTTVVAKKNVWLTVSERPWKRASVKVSVRQGVRGKNKLE